VSVWAVLAAGGSGERLGADRPKAFVRLGERVLLAESLERLDASEWIDAIVVAAPPGWEEPAILLAEELGCSKVSACVAGGPSRAESVRLGLAEVPDEAAVVVVHDAARPFVEDEVIARVLRALNEGWDGAVPVLPIADTVKRVDGERVVETLDRTELRLVQTPQAFVASVLRDAFAGDVSDASDCASLVEARGGRVRAVAGDPKLVKVTDASDLARVAALL
jgi:2-C-methyl-D-erythritol 4-phosphate cytidylyltransferase